MITQMTVKNFKALGDLPPVDLAPFTVLIGPNDTGKSSFLEAIYAISESTRSNLTDCFWSRWTGDELVHQQKSDGIVEFSVLFGLGRQSDDAQQGLLRYSLAVAFTPGPSCRVFSERIETANALLIEEHLHSQLRERTAVYSFRLGQAFSPQAQSDMKRVGEALPSAALARWDVEELAMPSRLPAERRYPIDPSGYGLATCIAEMKLGKGVHFQALRDAFCRQFRDFDDILIERTNVRSVERDSQFQKQLGSGGEGYALFLQRKDGIKIPAGLASGGILVSLAYLTLVNLEEPRKLLLIEEPENALHPGRMKEIVDVLRQATKPPTNCQIVMTTHSPLLLDHFQPEEVRVFLRNDKNDIEVHNLANVPDIRERLNYLMLGELVYNEGEQELVKEIREHAGAHPG